jgi:transposase
MFDNFLAVLLPGFNLIDFQLQAESLLITARPTASSSPCPRCQIPSGRIPSYYTRHPKDLPLAGFAVGLVLQVRRFRCLNPACQTMTFVERLPQLVAPNAQRTIRLSLSLQALALALGGEAGAPYAAKSAIAISPDSLLRLLKQTTLPPRPTPRVLAVDDFALRKGHRYGTLLVDGETHRPVELLEDRTANTLAQWLRQHPGIEIITRDRSTEYAGGASEGAPTAIQIADRWHWLTNWREALERGLDRLRPQLQNVLTLSGVMPESALTPISIYERERRRGTKDQMIQQTRRTQRYEVYRQVKDLQKQGYNLRQVAGQLKLGLRRVRRYFASEQFPEQARPVRVKSILDPYAAYLQQRWDSGCHNNRQLWQEIQAQG